MTDLEKRQKAGQAVEAQMLKVLLGFYPAHELKVSDIIFIASAAQAAAFDAFSFDKE